MTLKSKMKLNKYAMDVHRKTKNLSGAQKYFRIGAGAVTSLLVHKFDLWDYTKELRRNGGIITLKDGAQLYIPRCDHDLIQMEIARDNDYFAWEALYKLKKYVQEGASILDIGANIGNHTVFFAKECRASKIYSFEPQKDVFELLKENIRLNRLEDVCTPYNLALGKASGNASIAVYDANNCGGTSLTMSGVGDIPVSSLDSMRFSDIDLIKIDVEGFEYDVLEGSKETLERENPLIFIELWEDNFVRVNHLLNTYGYVIKDIICGDYLYSKLS